MESRSVSAVSDGSNSKVTKAMWIAACLIGMSSFMFGYALANLNSCLVLGKGNSPSACFHGDDDKSPGCPKGTIYDDLDLDTVEASLATALTILGAWIGCMVGSQPSERFGRRATILGNNILYIAGSILAGSGVTALLFVGRLITGFGVGITSVVAPVLLSEIATEKTRGTVTTLHQVFITAGILGAGLVAYGFVTYVDNGWQYAILFGAVPAVIMLLFLPLVPESPKWLVEHKNDREGARKVLLVLRQAGSDIDSEINELMGSSNAGQRSDGTSGDGEATWAEVFAWKKAVMIGIGLMVFQVMTGINSVIFYSTTIFGYAGFTNSILATVSVGVINLGTTILSAYVVDKTGRKTLLVGGTWCCLAALMVLSMVLWVGDGMGSHLQGIIAVLAVLVFVFGFAIGSGAVCWTVMSEVMPTRLRAKAFSLFVSVNWFLNLLIALLTLPAIDGLGGEKSSMDDDEQQDAQKLGVAILYLMFAVIVAISLPFLLFVVPETRGRTPEELTGGPGEGEFAKLAALNMVETSSFRSGSGTDVKNPLSGNETGSNSSAPIPVGSVTPRKPLYSADGGTGSAADASPLVAGSPSSPRAGQGHGSSKGSSFDL